jgi:hypothetical protein
MEAACFSVKLHSVIFKKTVHNIFVSTVVCGPVFASWFPRLIVILSLPCLWSGLFLWGLSTNIFHVQRFCSIHTHESESLLSFGFRTFPEFEVAVRNVAPDIMRLVHFIFVFVKVMLIICELWLFHDLLNVTSCKLVDRCQRFGGTFNHRLYDRSEPKLPFWQVTSFLHSPHTPLLWMFQFPSLQKK